MYECDGHVLTNWTGVNYVDCVSQGIATTDVNNHGYLYFV